MAGENDHVPVGHVVVKVGTAGVADVGYWTAAHVRAHGIAVRALEIKPQWALRAVSELGGRETLPSQDADA